MTLAVAGSSPAIYPNLLIFLENYRLISNLITFFFFLKKNKNILVLKYLFKQYTLFFFNFFNFIYFFNFNYYFHLKFFKNNIFILIFNFRKQQPFFTNFFFLKNKIVQTLSLGVLLNFLFLRAKSLRHTSKGLNIFLNFFKKINLFLNFKKNSNYHVSIYSLKKKYKFTIIKLYSLLKKINITSFFLKPELLINQKIKRFIKKRIKKKLVFLEKK